jgi:hypothetical protein
MNTLARCGLMLLVASAAHAQTVTIGVHGALGDYRESAEELHFRGGGGGFSVTLSWRQWRADATGTQINYDPVNNASLQSFKSKEGEGHVGYAFTPSLIGEVGVVSRSIDPDFAAQKMTAIPVGLRYLAVIAPGASIGIRGDYLAGAKFSGGGSASLAVELGMFFWAGASNGRWRFTGDYSFQRVDRKTGGLNTPIQQSLAKLGLAVGF